MYRIQSLTLPLKLTVDQNREFAKQELKTGESVRLGEEIGNLLGGGKIRKRKRASKIMVANKVKSNLKMLSPLVKNWIAGNLDGTACHHR